MDTLREGTGLDQSQYSDSLKKQINSAISKLKNAKTAVNNQYNTTYSYKSGGITPIPPAGGGAVNDIRSQADAIISGAKK
jgi:hypothetical protein